MRAEGQSTLMGFEEEKEPETITELLQQIIKQNKNR